MTEQLLRNLSRKITQAQESIVMDRPWEADARLREMHQAIRAQLFGDYVEPRRERLISRGLNRSRKPRTEE